MVQARFCRVGILTTFCRLIQCSAIGLCRDNKGKTTQASQKSVPVSCGKNLFLLVKVTKFWNRQSIQYRGIDPSRIVWARPSSWQNNCRNKKVVRVVDPQMANKAQIWNKIDEKREDNL